MTPIENDSGRRTPLDMAGQEPDDFDERMAGFYRRHGAAFNAKGVVLDVVLVLAMMAATGAVGFAIGVMHEGCALGMCS